MRHLRQVAVGEDEAQVDRQHLIDEACLRERRMRVFKQTQWMRGVHRSEEVRREHRRVQIGIQRVERKSVFRDQILDRGAILNGSGRRRVGCGHDRRSQDSGNQEGELERTHETPPGDISDDAFSVAPRRRKRNSRWHAQKQNADDPEGTPASVA